MLLQKGAGILLVIHFLMKICLNKTSVNQSRVPNKSAASVQEFLVFVYGDRGTVSMQMAFVEPTKIIYSSSFMHQKPTENLRARVSSFKILLNGQILDFNYSFISLKTLKTYKQFFGKTTTNAQTLRTYYKLLSFKSNLFNHRMVDWCL